MHFLWLKQLCLLKLTKIGKIKWAVFSYSSPPRCVARRREFLVVQRDVNWLLILEIREWTMHSFQLFPQVSTVYNSVSTLVPTVSNSTEKPFAARPDFQTTRQPVFNMCSARKLSSSSTPLRNHKVWQEKRHQRYFHPLLSIFMPWSVSDHNEVSTL